MEALANLEGIVERQNHHTQVWADEPPFFADEPLRALIGTLAGAGVIVMLVVTAALLSI